MVIAYITAYFNYFLKRQSQQYSLTAELTSVSSHGGFYLVISLLVKNTGKKIDLKVTPYLPSDVDENCFCFKSPMGAPTTSRHHYMQCKPWCNQTRESGQDLRAREVLPSIIDFFFFAQCQRRSWSHRGSFKCSRDR